MDKISPEFAEALVKATGEIEGAYKNATNPHFRNDYANMESVVDAIKPHLIANGITLLQPIVPNETRCIISTILLYKTGEMLHGGSISLPLEKNTPQGFCSAVTYGRRYSASSFFFLPTFDDDGNEASGVPQIAKDTKSKGFIYFWLKFTEEQKKKLENAGGVIKEGVWKVPIELPEFRDYEIKTKEGLENARTLYRKFLELKGETNAKD